MKIISWNTNGLRATIKQGNFTPLFDKLKADVICLQETKCEEEQIPTEFRNYKKYYSYFSHSKLRKGYSGVAIFTKVKPDKVEYGMGIKEFDQEGRLIIAYFKNLVLINGYYPNGGSGPDRLDYKLRFYKAFLKFVKKLDKDGYKVIFCGDINTAHTAIDLARPKANVENTGFLPIERAWIDEVVVSGFTDVYRNFNPDKKDVYTYWDQKTASRDRNVGWRIDYFFANKKSLSKIKTFKTHTNYMGSDHCPIEINTTQ